MENDAATAFRTASFNTAGLITHKEFDDEASAEAWAKKHSKDHDKIVVEALVADKWQARATFKNER